MPILTTFVLVVRVGPAAEDAASVIPRPAHDRVLGANRHRRCNVRDERFQCGPRSPQRLRIRLMVPPVVGQHDDVELPLELPQHVEGTIGHAAVGRIGKALRQHQDPRSRGHGVTPPQAAAPPHGAWAPRWAWARRSRPAAMRAAPPGCRSPRTPAPRAPWGAVGPPAIPTRATRTAWPRPRYPPPRAPPARPEPATPTWRVPP